MAILSVGIGSSCKRRNPSVDEAPDRGRHPWRHQIGIHGGIIPERVAGLEWTPNKKLL
jgi:hypothetical protein